MKTIRFKNDWRYSRQGDVIEEGDGVAQLLIARGIAEEVQAEETETEDAGTEPARDGGENALPETDALPQIITRQVPGPNQNLGLSQGRSRRGGRG